MRLREARKQGVSRAFGPQSQCTLLFSIILEIGVIILMYQLKKLTSGSLDNISKCLTSNLGLSFYISNSLKTMVFNIYFYYRETVRGREREREAGRERGEKEKGYLHLLILNFYNIQYINIFLLEELLKYYSVFPIHKILTRKCKSKSQDSTSCQSEWLLLKRQGIINQHLDVICKRMWRREYLCTVGINVYRCCHYVKQYGNSSKN